MLNVDPMLYIGLTIILVLVIVLFSMLYSPTQYRELKKLFHEQRAADDVVYEGLRHSNVAEKLLFRWTTKDVEHYYE